MPHTTFRRSTTPSLVLRVPVVAHAHTETLGTELRQAAPAVLYPRGLPPPSIAWRIALAPLSMLAQNSAHAHGASAGMAGFGAGLIHPLITPAHLLLLLALGLWLGQQRPLMLRLPAFAFLASAAIGLLATTRFAVPSTWQSVMLCLALVVALLLATSSRLPPWAALPLFAGAGVALGLDSGVDSADSSTALVITLSATWLGLSLCMVNFAYYTSLLPQRKWAQIGVRIAGSWMAAICLLVLAFAFKSSQAA